MDSSETMKSTNPFLTGYCIMHLPWAYGRWQNALGCQRKSKDPARMPWWQRWWEMFRYRVHRENYKPPQVSWGHTVVPVHLCVNINKPVLPGCYSDTIGIPIMRDVVSNFLTRRDGGVPSSPGNIFITHGSDHGFEVCHLWRKIYWR